VGSSVETFHYKPFFNHIFLYKYLCKAIYIENEDNMSSKPQVKKEQYKRSTTDGKFMSFPNRTEAHSILFVFKDYAYQDRKTYEGLTPLLGASRVFQTQGQINKALNSSSGIELPFPKQLQDQVDLRLNGFERSLITERIASYLTNQTGSDASLSSLTSAASSITGDIAGLFQNVGTSIADKGFKGSLDNIAKTLRDVGMKDAAAGAAFLLRTFLPGDIGRSVGVYSGNVVNPKETLAFEGVNLKSYQFTWELYPFDRTDSDTIKSMINYLKTKSLPESQGVNFGGNEVISRAFLRYPSVVEIHLLGVDQTHFPRFKPCMIQSVNIDYGATGTIPIMTDGKPGAITLSMQLQELEIHTANDYSGATEGISTATLGGGG
jgi:hypothetical protein